MTSGAASSICRWRPTVVVVWSIFLMTSFHILKQYSIGLRWGEYDGKRLMWCSNAPARSMSLTMSVWCQLTLSIQIQ